MNDKIRILLGMVMAVIFTAVTFVSCNKEDEITVEKPVVNFDNETGVYEVRASHSLTISPRYDNAVGATYAWKLDGETIATTPQLTRTWDVEGTFYVSITVTADGGSSTEEARIEVLPSGRPVISLPLASEQVTVLRNAPFVITPEITNTELEDFTVEWKVDGEVKGRDPSFTFESAAKGTFNVEVTASNVDGSDTRSFTIEVVDELPLTVEFLTPTYFTSSTTRYTFPERPVCLAPVIGGEATTFLWIVNGVRQQCAEPIFYFVSSTPGRYTVSLTVNERYTVSVVVEVVDSNEQSRLRLGTSTSVNVLEYVPAPGQFIGDTSTGGMTGMELTHEAACRWAAGRIASGAYVSLGGFGGYIILGLDHSIPAGDDGYDFSITGNAFFNQQSNTGGSSEPGIVYVMQDVNGNGLPDDEWYELRGSETGKPETRSNYAVTYFRPSGAGMNVQWTDNSGRSGTIDYLASFHSQDYYYPAWITEASYTLRGTCLAARTVQNPETGLWDNNPFGWGYADNMGSDRLGGSDYEGRGQRNGFKISNAVMPDGTSIKLMYVDFVKIQTGVNSKAGWLGEVSTEILGFCDMHD